jgi:hypothetical protein
VTTKSVERTAEAIGDDIAQARATAEIDRAVQLDLPDHRRRADSHPLHPNGRHRRAGREGETAGQRRGKDRGSTGTHARSQAGLRVSPRPHGTKQGYPIRDPDSTTYTGAIETADAVWQDGSIVEAWQRGWSRAEKKVVIGDGAEWIWNLVTSTTSPAPMQIVDLYHARQHLWDVATHACYPHQQAAQKRLGQHSPKASAR